MSDPVHGIAIVGIVLAEALVLHAGYAGLSRVAGSELSEAFRDR